MIHRHDRSSVDFFNSQGLNGFKFRSISRHLYDISHDTKLEGEFDFVVKKQTSFQKWALRCREGSEDAMTARNVPSKTKNMNLLVLGTSKVRAQGPPYIKVAAHCLNKGPSAQKRNAA